MLAAIVLGSLVVFLSVGGKVILAGVAALPIVGFAVWYVGQVGPLPEGVAADLIFGAMAAQMILLPLSALLYGPGLARRFAASVSRRLA